MRLEFFNEGSPILACSPDGIVLLRTDSDPFNELGGAGGNLNAINYCQLP